MTDSKDKPTPQNTTLPSSQSDNNKDKLKKLAREFDREKDTYKIKYDF
jgi:hypothetical protein